MREQDGKEAKEKAVKCVAMIYYGLGEEGRCSNEAVAGDSYCERCLGYGKDKDE